MGRKKAVLSSMKNGSKVHAEKSSVEQHEKWMNGSNTTSYDIQIWPLVVNRGTNNRTFSLINLPCSLELCPTYVDFTIKMGLTKGIYIYSFEKSSFSISRRDSFEMKGSKLAESPIKPPFICIILNVRNDNIFNYVQSMFFF